MADMAINFLGGNSWLLTLWAFAFLFIQIVMQNKKIQSMLDSRPNLLFEANVGYGMDTFPVVKVYDDNVTVGSTGNEIELKWQFAQTYNVIPREPMQYLWVDIYNRPADKENGLYAEHVYAKVEFEGEQGYYARWDTKINNPFMARAEILQYIDIPPYGPPARLKIALKDKDEDVFYGWSELSYQDAFWKTESLKMSGKDTT